VDALDEHEALMAEVDGRVLVAARARLQRNRWKQVTQGMDGLGAWRHGARRLHVIHSVAVEQDGEVWEHISLSRDDDAMPTWEQVRDVFHEVCGPDALGIIVIPPKSEHVNLAEVAHAWRCVTRRPLPDFTRGLGTI
jgi:hypothetical protein